MSSASDGGRADRRQLLLVAIAILALVVAAFLAPSAQPQEGQSGPDGDGEQPGLPEGGGEGDGDPPSLPFGDGDGNPIPIPIGEGEGDGGPVYLIEDGEGGEEIEIDDESFSAECVMALSPEPSPGATVTVVLVREAGPISGATVRFNGESIGTTDERGQVSGMVPYERDLNVSVSFPEGVSCSFDRQIETGQGSASALDSDGSGAWAVSESRGPTGGSVLAAAAFGRQESSTRSDSPPRVQAGNESTVSVSVSGNVEILVSGTPYPGETVDIRAHIDGVPMATATVTVDGERVGATDENGRYDGLAIPADGSETVTVTVSRGDFEGAKTITVALLEASVRPNGLLTLPGASASLVVERGDERVEEAAVSIDGERVGSTGPDGTVGFTAPTDLDATITVSTNRQQATVEMRSVYETTALALLVYGTLSAVIAGIVARKRGRKQGGSVLLGSAGLLTLVVVHAYGGRTALALTGLVSLAVAVFAFAYRERARLASDAETAGGWFAAFGQWLTRSALAVARRLETMLDNVGPALSSLLESLRSRPASVRGLLDGLWRSLRSLPSSVATAVPSGSSRSVAVAVLAVVLLAAGGLLGGWQGVLAALGVLAMLALFLGRDDDEESESEATVPAPPEPEVIERDESGPATLRERWRAFARWVRPGRWRKSTTGDVERAAREKGYPDGHVETLAAAFRRVEYSDSDVPDETRDHADEAFDRLADHRNRGDER